MTNKEINKLAAWLSDNEPCLDSETDEFWELFAYRIMDKLENTEKRK